MKNEDIQLLLQDICARLPYKVKASYYGAEEECETWDEVEGITTDGYVDIGQYSLPIECIKPYLFPLSNMDKKQRKYIRDNYTFGATYELFDWLDKNHFDYRGLIEKGLAIDATGLNIY